MRRRHLPGVGSVLGVDPRFGRVGHIRFRVGWLGCRQKFKLLENCEAFLLQLPGAIRVYVCPSSCPTNCVPGWVYRKAIVLVH